MEIVVRYKVPLSKQYGSVVKEVIRQATEKLQITKDTTLSVSFVGDAKMKKLNREYRNKDRTTNVLSFSTHDSYVMIPDSQNDLGDIFISLPEAKREAKKYGWTLRFEIARLALHGFLHLLDYDHEKEKEAKIMEGIEKKILKSYA